MCEDGAGEGGIAALVRGGGGRVGGLEGGEREGGPPSAGTAAACGELSRAGERVSSRRGMCVRGGKPRWGAAGGGKGQPLSPGGRAPAEFEPRLWVAPRILGAPRAEEAEEGVPGRLLRGSAGGQGSLGFGGEPTIVVPAIYLLTPNFFHPSPVWRSHFSRGGCFWFFLFCFSGCCFGFVRR